MTWYVSIYKNSFEKFPSIKRVCSFLKVFWFLLRLTSIDSEHFLI